jgi:hypothetical protein
MFYPKQIIITCKASRNNIYLPRPAQYAIAPSPGVRNGNGIGIKLFIAVKSADVVNRFTDEDIDRIIQMAWEDRTPFEAIEFQFGLKEKEVIEFMRLNSKDVAQTDVGSWHETFTKTGGRRSSLQMYTATQYQYE